jgi:glycosyltransferase involved in cell wall biosynthesis
VRVVPSGFDPARFPWPWPKSSEKPPQDRKVILFAGLVQEWMKGFHVLKEAVDQLSTVRNDFEVWVTEDPLGRQGELVRPIGWQSQQDLPQVIRHSDIVVVPTIAEEALGRAAVEAMACGRPVVASRIGGLPWTVPDGGTGLLFEPGNSRDLAQKLARLLDDACLRERLGTTGRKRFEEEYTWDQILKRHYRPLLGEPIRQVAREQGAAR